MRAGFPPLDVGLELAELVEGAVDPLGGGQDLVHVLDLDPVGHQRELQVVHRTLAQAALAGGFLDVPEIRPRGRCLGQLVAVVGDRHAPHQHRRATLLGGIGDQLLGAAELGPVEALVHALVAAAHQVRAFDLHQVPVDVAGIDHDLDPGHFAVVLALDQRAAVLGTERLEDRRILGFLAGAAVGDHDHVRCCLDGADSKGEQPGRALEQVRFHQWFLLPVPRDAWPVFLLL
ncbi:hypothetical protein D3C81_1467960 [compost metagenome]